MQDKELTKLLEEIEKLKRKKERELVLSKSYEERNQLVKEIQQLELLKRNPASANSFGNTFMRGLKITGKGLWKAIKKGSRNLERNSPEFRQMAKPQSPSKPFSPLTEMYIPRNQEPVRMVKRRVKQPKRKGKKTKQLMTKKQKKSISKRGYRITDKATNPMLWDLP